MFGVFFSARRQGNGKRRAWFILNAPREYGNSEGFGSVESQGVAELVSTPLYFGTSEKTGSARGKAQGKRRPSKPGWPWESAARPAWPGPATHLLRGASAFASKLWN